MTCGGLSPERRDKLRADAEASAGCPHMDSTAVLALLDECDFLRHLVTLMREWRDAREENRRLFSDMSVSMESYQYRESSIALSEAREALLAHHDQIEQAKETA